MNERQTFPELGRSRAVIENVTPQIDGGRYPIKRTVGQRTVVEADIFADGHEQLSAVVKYRPENSPSWSESPMQPVLNDRWRGEFVLNEMGHYYYTIQAWLDPFKSWRFEFGKKLDAGQEISIDLPAGAALIREATRRAPPPDAARLEIRAEELASGQTALESFLRHKVFEEQLAEMMDRYSDRRFRTTYERELGIVVDPSLAGFSTWYEMFPRSCAAEPGRHGTFKDCEVQLPRIARMGFDVLYFPPIHPIGRASRKGRNNNRVCQPGDPGSPWGIGASEGGHKAVHPSLGTLEDFRRLVRQARDHGIVVGLDIAFQCSPDHPYAKEHPEWFRHRADGSIQYAENPPKAYEDILPFDFECNEWRGLWRELKSIFDFWIEQGVRIFRVDNPHTKSFTFWEWCIANLKHEQHGLIFLAEAFTRPKVMRRLAKLGFTQSYNYFPWRNSKTELTDYFTDLTRGPDAQYFRPNLWPNTPDILTEYLQHGGRPAFMIRLILAATLGANYGIYGPAFELCENQPRETGSEEYLNSEKYEIRHWNLSAPDNLEDLIARINQIRKDNPALQSDETLEFHAIDNDQMLAYTKTTTDGGDTILTVVNLDPHHTHQGWLELPIEKFRLEPRQTYQMHDLLTGARFLWKGRRNYVELNPQHSPAHVFRIRQRVRTEQDFDYFI